KFVDAQNLCPHCGKSSIVCDGCSEYSPYCLACKKEVAALPENHRGAGDKRLVLAEDVWRIIEGKTWDGSDLVQANGSFFASKRFVDWLLKVHAAPFCAEPAWILLD